MIKEQHNRAWIAFLDRYSWWLMKRQFRGIRFLGEVHDRGLPVLMIGNHFSWYDGFIQYHLNKRILHRKFHVMMLEEQLQRYKFLNKVGAFSIYKKSRDIIKSLNHAVDILHTPQNMLLLFPQGEIQSLYTQPFHFEKGLDFILKKVDTIQIIFNVNLLDYFSFKKPELAIYFKEFDTSKAHDIHTLETAFNGFSLDCKNRQVEE